MIKELIIQYMPTILVVIGFVSDFCVVAKKIKNISFKGVESKLENLISQNKELHDENMKIKKQLSIIIDEKKKVKDYELHQKP